MVTVKHHHKFDFVCLAQAASCIRRAYNVFIAIINTNVVAICAEFFFCKRKQDKNDFKKYVKIRVTPENMYDDVVTALMSKVQKVACKHVN